MKDRSALAVSMVYVLLDHFTAEEIQAACEAPSASGGQPAATAAEVPPPAPKQAKISKFEQRSGGMRSGAHEGLMSPLEKGVRGIETGHQMPGRSWRAVTAMRRWKARRP